MGGEGSDKMIHIFIVNLSFQKKNTLCLHADNAKTNKRANISQQAETRKI